MLNKWFINSVKGKRKERKKAGCGHCPWLASGLAGIWKPTSPSHGGLCRHVLMGAHLCFLSTKKWLCAQGTNESADGPSGPIFPPTVSLAHGLICRITGELDTKKLNLWGGKKASPYSLGGNHFNSQKAMRATFSPSDCVCVCYAWEGVCVCVYVVHMSVMGEEYVVYMNVVYECVVYVCVYVCVVYVWVWIVCVCMCGVHGVCVIVGMCGMCVYEYREECVYMYVWVCMWYMCVQCVCMCYGVCMHVWCAWYVCMCMGVCVCEQSILL